MSEPSEPVHIPTNLHTTIAAEEIVIPSEQPRAHVPDTVFSTPAPGTVIPARPLPARYTWAGTLILACFALGIAGSLVELERTRVQTERARLQKLQTVASLTESRQEDLGKFLADPNTHFVRLVRTPGSAVNDAAIAWNDVQQMGFIFSDQLPTLDSEGQYQVWGTGKGAIRSQIASFTVKPGASIFLFQSAVPMASMNHLEISVGASGSPSSDPILSGTID